MIIKVLTAAEKLGREMKENYLHFSGTLFFTALQTFTHIGLWLLSACLVVGLKVEGFCASFILG